MNSTILDCQGLPCPKPVMQVIGLLQQSRPVDIEVVVDNLAACDNVSRLLVTKGYTVEHRKEAGLWHVTAHTDTAQDEAASSSAGLPASPVDGLSQYASLPSAEDMRTVVLVVTPVLGSGDDTLGGKLMKSFLGTLPEMDKTLWRVILLNGGVTLAAEGSHVLSELQALEKSGVTILVCGTCLEHFGLMPKKAVGTTTNMLDVVTCLQMAHKIIRA